MLVLLSSKRIIILANKPSIVGYAAVGGIYEKDGPLGREFDYIFDDPTAGEKCWEQAESKLQKTALEIALKKSSISKDNIGVVFAGDLLNQCVGSTFGIMEYCIPFAGVYGACSTMALSLIMACAFVDGGLVNNVAAVTSSHFCSAERQFRFPLEYAGQRPPTSQRTACASGAIIVSNKPSRIYIKSACLGKVVDYGITDANNMGAAMAPDDVKIRLYPTHEGMVFFYTQIQYLRGFRALFKIFSSTKIYKKQWT